MKSGLSQHQRHRHPDEYALHLQLGRDNSRNHVWIDEEICLLAKMGLSLINESKSNTRTINQLLSNRFPGRTANQISCLRKRQRYKDIYQRILNESTSSNNDSICNQDCEQLNSTLFPQLLREQSHPNFSTSESIAAEYDARSQLMPELSSIDPISPSVEPAAPVNTSNSLNNIVSSSPYVTHSDLSDPNYMVIEQSVNNVLRDDGFDVILNNIDVYWRRFIQF